MGGTNTRPKTRSSGVTAVRCGDSLFLHDSNAGKVHELNGPAASVYALCDGSRTVHEISLALKGQPADQSDAIVLATLAQLDRYGLTEAKTPEAAGFSRRRFAATVVAPLILSVASPAPAAILSSGGDGGGTDTTIGGGLDGDGGGVDTISGGGMDSPMNADALPGGPPNTGPADSMGGDGLGVDVMPAGGADNVI